MMNKCLNGTIRILVCDQQALIRSGLKFALESAIDMEIVGEVSHYQELEHIIQAKKPNIILLGLSTDPALMTAIGNMRKEAERFLCSIIVIHGPIADDTVMHALLSGAVGAIGYDSPPSVIPDLIRRVAEGGSVITPMVARRLLDRLRMAPHPNLEESPSLEALSTREVEITQLLAWGYSNTEIARMLSISGATVRSHVSHILCKLNLRNRVEVVIFAYQYGLIAG